MIRLPLVRKPVVDSNRLHPGAEFPAPCKLLITGPVVAAMGLEEARRLLEK